MRLIALALCVASSCAPSGPAPDPRLGPLRSLAEIEADLRRDGYDLPLDIPAEVVRELDALVPVELPGKRLETAVPFPSGEVRLDGDDVQPGEEAYEVFATDLPPGEDRDGGWILGVVRRPEGWVVFDRSSWMR